MDNDMEKQWKLFVKEWIIDYQIEYLIHSMYMYQTTEKVIIDKS